MDGRLMWLHISSGRCSRINFSVIPKRSETYENIVHLKSDLFIFNIYNMEKLLQILNEYERSLWSDREWLWIIDEDWFFCTRKSKKGNPIVQHSSLDEAILQIISKKFWFIERLVDNDKIILQKGIIRRVEYDNYWVLEDIHRYSDYESILMYLSIQDDPISFLISILK